MNPYVRIFMRAFLASGASGCVSLMAMLSAPPADDLGRRVDWLLVIVNVAATFFSTAYAGWASLDDAPGGMVQMPKKVMENFSAAAVTNANAAAVAADTAGVVAATAAIAEGKETCPPSLR